ncbi:hypothetical protein Y032_0001g41 [Ancylostoma ceylanicum]|uniref:RRM domain-containing protein n=1 Tax=Ancylostoma ceylanicum TaxID=53326 RepID=A0A016W4B6_9BILA|nr:hypothetical protein Y032_0001g41 [Ancylostoma ceylanicum]
MCLLSFLQLAALSLQMQPYSNETTSTAIRVHSRTSILDDSIATQAYNPMFGAEKLFAGLARPQTVAAQNTNMFGYPCSNHTTPTLMPSRYGRPEDALPLLLAAGGGNVFLKPPPTPPTCLSGNVSLCSNESGSSAGSPPNVCVPLLSPTESKSPLTGRRMLGTPSRPASQFLSNEVEVFARKVFVGGLPIDVTEDEIWQTFSVFGNVLVDWPRRPDGTSARDEESGRGSRSMTGYVFLVFEEESSVQYLVSECHKEDDRLFFSREGEKAAKFTNRSPKPIINCDLFTTLAGFWTDTVVDNTDGEYEQLIQQLRDSANKAVSSRTTKRRLSHETLELIRQRGAARAAGNYQLTSKLARRCREAIKEDLKERAVVLAEAAEAGRSIRNPRRDFANRKTKMTALRRPDGTISSSGKVMEKVIYDFYSDLFDSHVHFPPCHLREDGYDIPSVLPSEVRHAITSVKNRTAPSPDRI